MKKFITAAVLSVGISAVAAPAIAPQLAMTKAIKVGPKVDVLERSTPAATVGLHVQVGIGDSCKSFAGYWFQSNKPSAESTSIVAPAQQLQFAVSSVVHPVRPCAESYRMQEVIVPIHLERGDEESSAQTLFSVNDVGSFSVSYDWKTGKAAVQKVQTLE